MKKLLDFFKSKLGIGTIGGATVAGYFGKGIGTAGFFGAINSMIPYAIIGALISYLSIKCFKFFKKNNKQNEIIKEQDYGIKERDVNINKLKKDLEESEDMKKKIVDYYEGPEDLNKRSFIKLPIIGAFTAFFGRLFRH